MFGKWYVSSYTYSLFDIIHREASRETDLTSKGERLKNDLRTINQVILVRTKESQDSESIGETFLSLKLVISKVRYRSKSLGTQHMRGVLNLVRGKHGLYYVLDVLF